mgnify:CR=1 FL=1
MKKKSRLVQGVGVNDADYCVHKYENGNKTWVCAYYQTWASMLERAYSDKCKQKHPTYNDVTVCEEWHSFMRFRAWMETQEWKGKHLDKDLLVPGNKVYSPDTCVFVDSVVNNFLTDCAAARGEWPIGVCWYERYHKFRGQCRNPFTKKYEHLGYFTCPNQAHLAWKKRKHQLACQLADIQSDQRVAEALRIRYK